MLDPPSRVGTFGRVTQTADLDRALELIEALQRENKILREELQTLKQGLFGRKSERLQPGQLTFVEDGGDADPVVPCPPEPSTKKPGRSKPGHGRSPFAADLPRDTQILDVEEAERTCPTCSEAMRLIGTDVTERGHFIPARVVVRRFERRKYACPNGHGVVTAKAPEGVVKGAKYEPSVYAYIGTSKYCDHLPLHRLSGMLKRQGLHLAKQQMWDMLVTLDELVAQPVLEQMRTELLAEPVLHSDETPVTMKVEDGRGSATGWIWGWRNLREADDSKVLIEFRTSRGRDGPIDFLGDWSGTLICDGYSGQNEVIRRNGIIRAGCWAHARRKLKEALDTGSKKAAELLASHPAALPPRASHEWTCGPSRARNSVNGSSYGSRVRSESVESASAGPHLRAGLPARRNPRRPAEVEAGQGDLVPAESARAAERLPGRSSDPDPQQRRRARPEAHRRRA